MYGFTLAISCSVKTSNIPSKFVKYIDVPLFKAVTLVVYGAAINWVNMSSKEMEFDGNDVVPSQDHDLRISMENLRLRGDCQQEKHIRGSHQVSLRGQTSQLVDWQSNEGKDVLKQLEACTAHPEEAGNMEKHQRKMTDKGREYRKEILDKKRTSLVSRIIRKSSDIDVLLYSHQNDVTIKSN